MGGALRFRTHDYLIYFNNPNKKLLKISEKIMFHTEISNRWRSYTIFEQMANIGAEVGRTINWKRKGNAEMSKNALYRALELIDLTINDSKNKKSLKEILRMREIFLDFCIGENIYHSTEKDWEKYFYYFTIAARK